MNPMTIETIQWLLFNLKPTTLAAIVADIDNNNLAGEALTLAAQLAQAAGEINVGDDDFSLMVAQAYEYVG